MLRTQAPIMDINIFVYKLNMSQKQQEISVEPSFYEKAKEMQKTYVRKEV